MIDLAQKLLVAETFCSIQGESTHAGRPCFFIRLAGCNLKCSYCDTVYARETAAGSERTLEQIIQEAAQSGINLVEITGGEPACQPGSVDLTAALLERNFEVLMETNGSVKLDKFPKQLKRIIDVKLPSSGMAQYNETANYDILHAGDELKFVTGSYEDFVWALDWIRQWDLDGKNVPLIFSAVFGALELPDLVQWVLDAGLKNGRFQLQMHKFIWDPAARGV